MASQTQHQHQQQQSSYTSSSPSQPLINGSDESSITDTQSIVKQRIIHIPIGADESVHITSQSLSDTDATALLDILRTEITPLRVWIDIALLYSELGYWNRFEEILVEATQPQIQEKYVGQESDRIQVFNTLAAYYVRRAQSETDRERRNHYFTQANNMITAANRINNLDFRNFLGLGNIYLNQGDMSRADQQFDTALTSDRDNVPALMGKGIILYGKKKYEDALATFQHALRTNPLKCPASLRACIGMCLFELENMEKAELAFQRALQLDPTCVPALVGLTTLVLNSENDDLQKATMALGYQLRAFQIDNDNPVVLNHIADSFFQKGDLDKVEICATRIINSTTSNQIRGEAYYHMARMYHSRQDYEEAFRYYYQLVNQLHPDHVRGRFGLGQMYLKKRDINSAILQFEHVLRIVPDNFESHKILGVLHARNDNIEKALTHLKRAQEIQKRDEQVLLLISQLEKKDVRVALKAITDAKRVMMKKGKLQNVTYEFWNNMGVLHHKNKQHEEALNCLMKSAEMIGAAKYLESMSDRNESADDTPMDTSTNNGNDESVITEEITREQMTVLYNIACLYEDMDRQKDAMYIYRSIVRQHPTYIDCHMRIALLLSADSSKFDEAMKWCDFASRISPSDPIPQAMMGYLLVKRERWSQAQIKFENIIRNVDSKDPYSRLGLGNIYFSSIRPDLKQTAERMERSIQHGTNYFERVLRSDGSNVYAALSLGAIIAERGFLDQAREIFLKVMEANAEIPEAYINLGHTYMCLNQFVNAAKIYQNCLKKFFNDKDARLLNFLARAQFDARNFSDCVTTLERAISLYPDKLIFPFDLAVTQYEHSKHMIHDIPTAKLTVKRVSMALEKIQEAVKSFKSLASQSDKDVYVAERAKSFSDRATVTLKRIEAQYKTAEKAERDVREKAEAQRKALEEAILRKKQEEEEERLKKEQEEQAMRRRAEENRQKFNELHARWKEKETPKKEKSEKRTKKKDDMSDFIQHDEGDDDGGDMQQSAPPSKKKGKASKSKPSGKRRLKKVRDEREEGAIAEEQGEMYESQQTNMEIIAAQSEYETLENEAGDGTHIGSADFESEEEFDFSDMNNESGKKRARTEEGVSSSDGEEELVDNKRQRT